MPDLGNLELGIVARDRFSGVLDRASRQLDRFAGLAAGQLQRAGKFGLGVIAKNNDQFRQLHDTFGNVGIGAGLALDAILELTTGKGKLGLLDMIRQTRVLGHSIATWVEFGSLRAIDALDQLQSDARLAAGNVEGLFRAVTGDSVGAVIAFGRAGTATARELGRRRRTAEETQRELDRILAADPPPAKVPDVSGAVEREAREVRRALRSVDFQTVSLRRFGLAPIPGAGPAPAPIPSPVAAAGRTGTAETEGTRQARTELFRAAGPGRFGTPRTFTFVPDVVPGGSRLKGTTEESAALNKQVEILRQILGTLSRTAGAARAG